MRDEIIKLTSKFFQLLIDSTKENSVQWIKIDNLNNYNKNAFDLVIKYVQKKLLNNQALCNENSYYTNTENALLVLLCLKDIITNEFTYELISIDNNEKLIVFSDYDEKNFSLRLGNLVKFQNTSEGCNLEDDVESIKAIVGGFQDNE